MSQFEAWLNTKLQELKTDETVFGPYIISILEGDEETEEEKREGLTGILSDCLDNEDDIEKALNDILMRWKSLSDQNNDSANKLNEDVQKLDITEKMRAITQEKIANTKVKKFEKSEEEKKLKEAILSGYREGGDGSEEDEDDDGDTNLGPANSNAESVKQEEKEMQEKRAAAAAAKKEKDKQDRINQKNQAEERKKKAQEKAAKGERKSGR